MKNLLLIFVCLMQISFLNAQSASLQQADVEFPLRFLAADELEGRRTGERGNNLAARYIAEYFRTYNLSTAPEATGYYQNIPFTSIIPPTIAKLEINNKIYEQGEDLLIMTGDDLDIEAKAVFAGHGWVDEKTGHDDFKDIKVQDRVVFVLPGTPTSQDPATVFSAMGKKRALAAERGAVAVIELYRLSFPWKFFVSYFNKESLQMGSMDGKAITYGFANQIDKSAIEKMQNGKKIKVKLANTAFKKRSVPSQNVIGILEGSDPTLKDEYVLLTAHYDHVGTGKNGGGAFTAADSIFNGARDNAMGTVALLGAVKLLSQNPPKRSTIFLAVTGEELGLLGSAYYAENPLIPLNKTIVNLNSDGAGYNNTSYASITGYGRIGIDDLTDEAVKSAGLEVFPNPSPEQGLYDRSDNVSFARKGVPAINMAPGITGFDEQISKYYHQVADEAESIDFQYFTKWCQAFANLATLVGNAEKKPTWQTGDKYEAAGKELYSKE